MTTPANFGTADRIVRFAMEDAGLLQDGTDPTGEQMAKYIQRLNDMINMWQTQGLKLWLLQDIAITLVAGTSTYTLGPLGTVPMVKPMRILQGYYLDTNNIRRPLIGPLAWDDWLRLSNPTVLGAINSFFENKQINSIQVAFYNTPDVTAAAGTVHLLTQTQVTNFVGITDATAFPPEWFLALRWGLADELATGQPKSIMDRCAQRALAYRTALEDWDVEDGPTRFEPDSRSQFYNHNFM
jgi:hypothetical protein